MIFAVPEIYNFPQLTSLSTNPQKSVGKIFHCIFNLKTSDSSFNMYQIDKELR
jgi:hypothetical protein